MPTSGAAGDGGSLVLDAERAGGVAARVQGVAKTFERSGRTYQALAGVSFAIADGEFLCIIGPSGCGKTTLLNLLAGFEQPTAGTVEAFGAPVTGPDSSRAVIFQDISGALFPWLSTYENVLFGPSVRKEDRQRGSERARHYLAMVGLWEHRDKFPFELSGGMKQRMQIARALVNEPRMLLMDEPFAALDAITKRIIQREFRALWEAERRTVLFITHDIAEAVDLGTRVAVMTSGPEARIKEIVDVSGAGMRRGCAEFQEMCERLEALIEQEVDPHRV